jgi:ABC-type Fe3+/spermidine/putrescine transport system ATPase subunit
VLTHDGSLKVRDLAALAGSFRVGPVSLDVPAGRVLVILGPSGSGKSTLLTAVAGLRPSASGTVHLGGMDVTAWRPEARRIGMVFQDGALFPHLTVRENIRFGPRAAGMPSLATADGLLAELDVARFADRLPRTLSGGERQRVALARALAIEPRLLLLDEPLSALDQPTREEMRGQLRQILADQGIPAIHVTHDRDEALVLADDLAIIADGAIHQTGKAVSVVSQPADSVAARLLGWTDLGLGVRERDQVQVGDLVLRAAETSMGSGLVRIYYRPEEVLLRPTDELDSSPGSIRATVQKIDPTVPLARVSLASTPAISVFSLHRDIYSLNLEAGSQVIATLPPHAVRIFPDDIAEA